MSEREESRIARLRVDQQAALWWNELKQRLPHYPFTDESHVHELCTLLESELQTEPEAATERFTAIRNLSQEKQNELAAIQLNERINQLRTHGLPLTTAKVQAEREQQRAITGKPFKPAGTPKHSVPAPPTNETTLFRLVCDCIDDVTKNYQTVSSPIAEATVTITSYDEWRKASPRNKDLDFSTLEQSLPTEPRERLNALYEIHRELKTESQKNIAYNTAFPNSDIGKTMAGIPRFYNQHIRPTLETECMRIEQMIAEVKATIEAAKDNTPVPHKDEPSIFDVQRLLQAGYLKSTFDALDWIITEWLAGRIPKIPEDLSRLPVFIFPMGKKSGSPDALIWREAIGNVKDAILPALQELRGKVSSDQLLQAQVLLLQECQRDIQLASSLLNHTKLTPGRWSALFAYDTPGRVADYVVSCTSIGDLHACHAYLSSLIYLFASRQNRGIAWEVIVNNLRQREFATWTEADIQALQNHMENVAVRIRAIEPKEPYLLRDIVDIPELQKLWEFLNELNRDTQNRLVWHTYKGDQKDVAAIIDALYGEPNGVRPLRETRPDRWKRLPEWIAFDDGREIVPAKFEASARAIWSNSRKPSNHIAVLFPIPEWQVVR